MQSSIKTVRIKFLAILAVVGICSIVAGANNNSGDSGEKSVLTTLEQRMQQKISVNFNETSIDNVIRALAEQADVDIIKSPEVTGFVTAKLTDVPLEEALNNILTAHGYGYVMTRNMIRIALAEKIEAEKIEEMDEKPEKLVSRIYRITYADVLEVEKALKKFMSPRGSLSCNPGTSNIIATDTESKIEAIDAFINEIDRITPQILVEVRIYDITSKDRFDLGIEWQAGRNSTYDSTGGLTTVGKNPTGGITNPFMTGAFSGATGKTSGTTGAMRLGWLNSSVDIDVVLRAQQQNINAKLLANPRVLVLDNETALFRIVSEIPYQELTESADGGTIGTTSFKEVGVELEVTPHVTRQQMVRLHLKPKFSVKVSDVTFKTGSLEYPQPVIDRREADTTLLIKDRQTVVLGGLRKKDVTQQINKIPLLGDIPLLGGLFRFKGEDTVISELVVFITPYIITNPALSETEKEQFEVTEFSGPEPVSTGAETRKK